MWSISHHITSLVINSLGGGHTHTHTHLHARIRHSRTEAILRNQAGACLVLKGNNYYKISFSTLLLTFKHTF